MSVEANKALVRRYIGLWDNNQWHWDQKDDWSEYGDVLSDDLVLHYGSQDIRGIDEFREGFAALFKALPDYRGTVDEIIGEGDRVAARFTCGGTHSDEYAGVPATGTSISNTGTFIVRIANDRIAEIWCDADNLWLLQQIGAVATE